MNDLYDDDKPDLDPYLTEYGCDFPVRCLMPGPHFCDECYDREMAEEWAREAERPAESERE